MVFRKIKIKAHTNSSQEKIEKISDSEYEIWIKEKPINGKANQEIIKELKRYFGCNEVQIRSGFDFNKKIIEIN